MTDDVTGIRRPSFEVACAHWKQLLSARRANTRIRWVMHENLILRDVGDRRELQFQTFDPMIDDSRIAVWFKKAASSCEQGHFGFALLLSHSEYSLSTFLCDNYDVEDHEHESSWNLFFAFGLEVPVGEAAEITDRDEWKKQYRGRVRSLSMLDFVCAYDLSPPWWKRLWRQVGGT